MYVCTDWNYSFKDMHICMYRHNLACKMCTGVFLFALLCVSLSIVMLIPIFVFMFACRFCVLFLYVHTHLYLFTLILAFMLVFAFLHMHISAYIRIHVCCLYLLEVSSSRRATTGRKPPPFERLPVCADRSGNP